MTKQQENRAFVKMLREFPKAFGRVSFRERLMLRTAFTYVLEARYEDRCSIVRQLGERCNQLLKDKGDLIDQIADIKANCDLAIEGRDIKIKELEQENAELEKESNRLFLEGAKRVEELEKENAELRSNGFTVSAMTEQQLEVALEKGEQLEKENKKLESDFRICEKNAETYYDQLSKAKEIIKDLMSFSVQLCDCRHTVDFEKTREKAVQFIKEIEK